MHFLDCVWTIKVCVLHRYEGEEYVYDEIKEVSHHGENIYQNILSLIQIKYALKLSIKELWILAFLWTSMFQFQGSMSSLKFIMSHVWKHQINLYVKMLL